MEFMSLICRYLTTWTCIALLSSLTQAIIARGADPTAFVRINQIGYSLNTQDRAFLMTLEPAAGAYFFVINVLTPATKPAIEYSGKIGVQLGQWGKYRVYPMDFGPISKPSSYIIQINLPVAVYSPEFRVAAPAKLYAPAMANALYFYENQRDGPQFIPTALRRAGAHLNDAQASVYFTPTVRRDSLIGDLKPTGAVVDASGGWADAGDYPKFVETISYTEALMQIGVRDFPGQMGAGAGSADFANEARFGLDFLSKMWDDKTQTLYYQVGIATGNDQVVGDHDIWRMPQDDDNYGGTDPAYRFIRHRPVFIAGPAGSKISPNLAGRLSADFALGFQLYRQSDPQLAQKYLVAAEHIFALADTTPGGRLLTTAPYDFYPESEWRDDMELGATELNLAVRNFQGPVPHNLPHVDSMFYLRAAAHWAHAYITGPNDGGDTLNLYEVSGLAHFELYRAMALAGKEPGLETSPDDLLADLKQQLDGAIAQAGSDPFRFGYAWNGGDTPAHGAGLAVMADEYAYLTGADEYAAWARQWSENILGENSWGVSFIVGDGTDYPKCIHNQVANIAGSLDGTPPILRGALVEGPSDSASSGSVDGMRHPDHWIDVYARFNAEGAVYKDYVESYSTNEPALDLTAPSFLMFAWQMAGAPAPLK
jgi:endoglucanase